MKSKKPMPKGPHKMPGGTIMKSKKPMPKGPHKMPGSKRPMKGR